MVSNIIVIGANILGDERLKDSLVLVGKKTYKFTLAAIINIDFLPPNLTAH